jgi:hypothetical protein
LLQQHASEAWCCARRFITALVEHEAGVGRDLAALKGANARRDDEMGALVDSLTSKLAGAREAVRAKQDLVARSEAAMQRLHSEVRVVVQRALRGGRPFSPFPAASTSCACWEGTATQD